MSNLAFTVVNLCLVLHLFTGFHHICHYFIIFSEKRSRAIFCFCYCELMAGPSPTHWVSPYLTLLHNFFGKVHEQLEHIAFVKALDFKSKLIMNITAKLKFCFIHKTASLRPNYWPKLIRSTLFPHYKAHPSRSNSL